MSKDHQANERSHFRFQAQQYAEDVSREPRWHQDRLWFADWGTQEVLAVEIDGKSEVIVRVPTARLETRLNFGGASQGPFSIDWLPDGRLLIISGRDQLLLRREPDEQLVTHADLTSLSDHAWNEIVVDGCGHVYLNGGGSDFVAGEPFAPSIVALVTPDGSARQVADGLALSNGMAVTTRQLDTDRRRVLWKVPHSL